MKFVKMKNINWKKFFDDSEMSVVDVANALGLSRASIYLYAKNGRIRYSKIKEMIEKLPALENYVEDVDNDN